MRIEVDMDGRYADVARFFEAYPEAMAQVCAQVEPAEVSIEGMTVKSLCEMLDGRIPAEAVKGAVTVRDTAAVVLGLRAAIERFANFMRNTTPPMTQAQKRLLSGLLETTAEEAVLLTCKDFYALHGLEDAQKLTVYEYMIARKAIYNERMQAYNMEMDAARRRRHPAAGGM